MKNLMRYAGLRLMNLLRESSIKIGVSLNLDYSQSLSFWSGQWCLDSPSNRLPDTLYFHGVSANTSRVHRWGHRVIVVEFAPDGGGTTYVLDAGMEVSPEDVDSFIESLNADYHLIRPRQWAKENDN